MTSAQINRQWVLASRPEGMVDPANFEWRESPLPSVSEGEFLVRNLYLSLDPAMRGWMTNARSYVPPVEIGEVMRGHCTARVIESRHPEYGVGDLVVGVFGWQDYAVSDGNGLMPVNTVPGDVPLTLPLGTLGITSLTAYFGLEEIAKAREGETIAISGAAGATGSVVGQIAKIKGCTAIGIAGGKEKCERLVDELGFDAAIDYKSERTSKRLRELAPKGVDVFWDNVGGEMLEAGISNLAMHGRVVLCGAISTYNAETPPPGPRNYMNLLVKRARMEGFVVFDYLPRADQAIAELVAWVGEGKLRVEEDVRDGLESAPAALMSLFDGSNTGKLLVKIGDP
jgi:NADPH-dependent curcumin reductase CurA